MQENRKLFREADLNLTVYKADGICRNIYRGGRGEDGAGAHIEAGAVARTGDLMILELAFTDRAIVM